MLELLQESVVMVQNWDQLSIQVGIDDPNNGEDLSHIWKAAENVVRQGNQEDC